MTLHKYKITDLFFGFSLFLNCVFIYLLQNPNCSSYNPSIKKPNKASQEPITIQNSKISVTTNVLDCNKKSISWKSVGTITNKFGCRVKETLAWIDSLKTKENQTFSQHGEDGITEAIFDKIGHGNKFFVEFGVGNGDQCNTRILRERHGWKGIMFNNLNVNSKIGLYKESVWVENVVELFRKYKIPKIIDYLSEDTDFGDFWLIKAILEAGYKPRAIVIEINRNFNAFTSLTVPESGAKQHRIHDATRWFGATPLAFGKLMRTYGYQPIYIEKNAVNMFFIEKSQLNNIDLSFAYWISKISTDMEMEKKLHYDDQRAFVHICEKTPCGSSENW